jgi:hypothetical protein
VGAFTDWVAEFEAGADRRQAIGDPNWAGDAPLGCALVRSIQRFQVGESGDGANLINKAEGSDDQDYAAAVRLFVAEERNHARMLALLLGSAGVSTISGHWTDAVFVRLRRALGLRLELMVLLIAEVVALRYYRALRDGTADPLVTDVADRILADEQRHVPFHCLRLRAEFATLARPIRVVVTGAWRVLLLGAAITVGYDHGPALRVLGVRRREFVIDVVGLFEVALTDIRSAELAPVLVARQS